MPPALLNARSLAKELDFTYDSILRWTRRGIIPSIKIGGAYFYHPGKVCRALAQRGEGETAGEVPGGAEAGTSASPCGSIARRVETPTARKPIQAVGFDSCSQATPVT